MKEYTITFKHTPNMTVVNVIPQKAIVTKTKGQLKEGEIQQFTKAWDAFLWCMIHNEPVEITIKIVVPGDGKEVKE